MGLRRLHARAGFLRRDTRGEAPLRVARLQDARRLDAGAHPRQGVAADQGDERPARPQGRKPLRCAGAADAGRRRGGPRRAPGAEAAAAARAGRGDAADAGRGAAEVVHRSCLALRAEVRRVPRTGGARGRSRGDPLPPRGGRDAGASRPRGRVARAAGRAIGAGRRDRRPRRLGTAELPAPAEARAAHRSPRPGARRAGASRHVVLLRPARVRGVRLADAAAGRAQAPPAAPAARPGSAAVRGSRGGARGRDVPRCAGAGARGRDGQARGLPLPLRPLARLDQDPLRSDRGFRRGRLLGRRGVPHRVRLAASRLRRGRRIRLRGPRGQRLQRDGAAHAARGVGARPRLEAALQRPASQRPGPLLGDPAPGGGGPLQGDHRGRPPPRSRLPPLPRRQVSAGLHAPGRSGGRARAAARARAVPFEPREGVLARGGVHGPRRATPREICSSTTGRCRHGSCLGCGTVPWC